MISLLLVRLQANRFRVGVLVLGIAAATTAFVVLTGQVAEQRLQLRGWAAAQGSPSYDILVRPAGSRTALEESQGLVRANFLSGQFGGITAAQWHQIQQLPGVQVAAPIAMVGYLLQTVNIPIDITGTLAPGEEGLFTASVVRTTARGLSTFSQPAAAYSYVSPARAGLVGGPGERRNGADFVDPRGPLPVCPDRPPAPFAARSQRLGTCWSLTNGENGRGFDGLPSGHAAAVVQWTFPFLLAAIDPEQEKALTGLDLAVTRGSYLPESGSPTGWPAHSLPVLMADHTGVDDVDEVSIEQLGSTETAEVRSGLPLPRLDALLDTARGDVVAQVRITAEQAYQRMVGKLLLQHDNPLVRGYWTSGPVSYRTRPDGTLQPQPVSNPAEIWKVPVNYSESALLPPDATDTGFRELRQHPVLAEQDPPGRIPKLATVGTFDESRLETLPGALREQGTLPGRGSESALGDYRTEPLTPVDAASSARLGNDSLLPDSNPAGYLLPTPTLITSLDAASVFTDDTVFDNVSQAGPISAVKVRVAGVRGTDPVSRERVRLAAEAITRTTGLAVDVTVGSVPAVQYVALPAGSAGRPALLLAERWQRKGVVVMVLRAVDRKSLLLFTLVLVVCGVFTANAAAAAARSPRAELSTLSCLGWTRGQLMRLLLGEIAVIGTGAGLLGALAALVVARWLGAPVTTGQALAAVPAALALTLLASAWPVWRASVPAPLPAAFAGRTRTRRGGAWQVRGLLQLAYRNLRDEPGRTGLGMLAVCVGSAGLTALLAITVAFRGSVVGSVLGDAISLQVRRVDYLAVVVTLLLAAIAVADVSYLNMRERQADLALLRAVGWTAGQLVRLIGTEGLLIGAVGSVAGAGVGLATTAAVAGSVPGSLWLPAAFTVLAGTLISGLATLLAALSLPLLVRTPALTTD